jgi:hypothetical protein
VKLSEYHGSQLTYRIFQVWKYKLHKKLDLGEINAMANDFREKFICIEFFTNWRQGIDL